MQVAHISSEATSQQDIYQRTREDVTDLLAQPTGQVLNEDFAAEQRKDPEINEVIDFMEREVLPADDKRACRIALRRPAFVMENGMLFYIDPRQGQRKRAIVPRHLRQQLLLEHHSSLMGGHFAAKKTYSALM